MLLQRCFMENVVTKDKISVINYMRFFGKTNFSRLFQRVGNESHFPLKRSLFNYFYVTIKFFRRFLRYFHQNVLHFILNLLVSHQHKSRTEADLEMKLVGHTRHNACQSEHWPFKTSFCFLLDKKPFNNRRRSLEIPWFFCSFWHVKKDLSNLNDS